MIHQAISTSMDSGLSITKGRLDGWAVVTQDGDFFVNVLDRVSHEECQDDQQLVDGSVEQQRELEFTCHGLAALRMLVEVSGQVPHALRNPEGEPDVLAAADTCLRGLEHFIDQFRLGMSELYLGEAEGVPSAGLAERLAPLWLPLNATQIAVMEVRAKLDAGQDHRLAASVSLKQLCKPLTDLAAACQALVEVSPEDDAEASFTELAGMLAQTLESVARLADSISDVAGLQLGRQLVELVWQRRG